MASPTYITTLANFGANVLAPAYLERFLSALRLNTGIVYPTARKGTLPMGAGKVSRWQFMNQPSAVTANTSEGDDPGEATLTTTTAEATMVEFGNTVPYSKLLAMTAMSGTKEEMLDALGYQAALSVEYRCIDQLDGATTLTVDAGAAMTVDALRQGAQKLVNVGAQPNPASPGGAYFVFVGSTEACYDMIGEGIPTFSQAKNDQIESALRLPLTGSPASSAVYGCIIKLSQSIQRVTSTSPDDDMNLLIAKDAFGVSELSTNAASPRVIDTTPEMSVHVPARNRGNMTWLLYFIAKLVRENSVVVISSDATGVG